MKVVFIHGAGEGARAEDEALVTSLRESLGDGYEVVYPKLPSEDEPEYEVWASRIREELPAIVVAHSVGGSIAAKCANDDVTALFLIAAPFWGGAGWRYDGWEELASEAVDLSIPVFLYQGRDDEVVPFEHLALWASQSPTAEVRAIDGAGHQLNGELSAVAADIRSLDS